MTSDFLQVLSENILIVVVASLILILVGIFAGYFIGNVSLRNHVQRELEGKEKEVIVQKQILDNVGLGVIVYDRNGIIYANKVIEQLPGFLKSVIPARIESFLDSYDKDNQLKANYLLGLQNGINTTRANYFAGNRIYEIKIMRKTAKTGHGNLEIVIVDDITQIKDDEKRQKDLAANVSHELKTPLTVLAASKTFFDSVTPNNMPPYEQIKTWGDNIGRNCRRMQDIVEDFLVLSMTSTTNKMGIFDIKECVDKAIASLSDYNGIDKVTINFADDGQPHPLLFGNGRLVMRIITNLLTNAVKYIDYAGKIQPNIIKVSIATIDDRIAVQVEDNGRGIAQKDLDHLFERFYRVDNSGSRDVGGSGIGLAIAKEIADMHDGSIAVTSKVGSGSTFTFAMPVASTIFFNARGDAKAGLVSEKPFYRAAALFLGSQISEASRSLGYDDMMSVVEEYEKTPDIEKVEKDKNLAKLISAINDTRYDDLMDELLFIDVEEEDLDDLLEESSVMEAPAVEETPAAMTEPAPAVISEPKAEEYVPEPVPVIIEDIGSEAATADEVKRQKEEARKLLTQQILPRSTQYKAPEPVENEIPVTKRPDDKVIHPITAQKEYNTETPKNSGKRGSLFGNLQKKTGDEQPEVRSSLKKIFDETDSLTGGKK